MLRLPPTKNRLLSLNVSLEVCEYWGSRKELADNKIRCRINFFFKLIKDQLAVSWFFCNRFKSYQYLWWNEIYDEIWNLWRNISQEVQHQIDELGESTAGALDHEWARMTLCNGLALRIGGTPSLSGFESWLFRGRMAIRASSTPPPSTSFWWRLCCFTSFAAGSKRIWHLFCLKNFDSGYMFVLTLTPTLVNIKPSVF